MLYETWESPDNESEEQIHRPYRRGYHEALADLLVRPREVTQWHTVRADRCAARLESRDAEELAEVRA